MLALNLKLGKTILKTIPDINDNLFQSIVLVNCLLTDCCRSLIADSTSDLHRTYTHL